jgi:hypothetical protein
MNILKATFFTDMGATHTIAVVVVKTDHDGTQAYTNRVRTLFTSVRNEADRVGAT